MVDVPEPIVRPARLPGLLVVEPTPIHDERGFFVRTMAAAVLHQAGVDPSTFVQENQSRSKQGTLRGLHFRSDYRERKIVRCARGQVFAVTVDLRPTSPTFTEWEGVELDDRTHLQLVIPAGCAFGFQVVSDWADVCYKHDVTYSPDLDVALAWNDPELAIPWPVAEPLLSPRDRAAPALAALRPKLMEWSAAVPSAPSA